MSRAEDEPVTGLRSALIILDGLGDRPHPATGGVSPVVAARTPNLDRLCAEGRRALVTVIGPGIAPESDTGVLALLGYEPLRDSPGRGLLEAAGAGLRLAEGDVAFRANFATLEGDGTVVDARVGRSLGTKESERLAEAVTRADLLSDLGIRAELRATVGHRGVLWLHPVDGGRLSPEVSNGDPFYEKVGGMGRAKAGADRKVPPVRPLDPSPEAERTARATNLFLDRARGLLAAHPVSAQRALAGQPVPNGLLVRNAGAPPNPGPPPFLAKYGRSGAAVTEMPVERGIARLLGLEDDYVGPMGSDRAAGYRARAARTRSALGRAAFVYVHLKGPDEPGHDGDAPRKREIIEAIDRDFFGPFLDGLDLTQVRLAVTADHATPCILRAHSDDPVPLLLCGAGIAPEGGSRGPPKFGDERTSGTERATIEGRQVLPLLLDPAGTPS